MAKDIIVVAPSSGGGRGGGVGRGGGSKGPITSNPKSKDPLNAKIKLDDQLFWTSLTALAAVGGLFYLYNTNPALIHGFTDPFMKLVQPPQPAVQNDTVGVAPASTDLPYAGGDLGAISAQYQQPLNYNYPSVPTNQQSFQYPQGGGGGGQYQGYQPSQFGGGYQTSYNPTFGQNANVSSFRVRFDDDGMLG